MNILKRFFVFTAIVAMIVAFVGCSDQDQSSVSIDDILGKVKITGTISYSEGQAYVNRQYAELYKGVANTPVYVLIKNADLLADTNALGYTTFETETDETGNYEIEIPVPNQGADIILQVPSFSGKRTVLKTWENDEPVFETQEVVFYIDEQHLRVLPNDILFKDLVYHFMNRQNASLTENVSMTVKVGLGVITEGGKPAFEFKAGLNVYIIVRYNNISENGNIMARVYRASTNEEGEARFNIPAPSKNWVDVPIEIGVYSYCVDFFTYYDKDSSDAEVIPGGCYYLYNNKELVYSVSTEVSFIESTEVVEQVRMVFLPRYGVETGYKYDNYDWNNVGFEQNNK